MLSTVPALSYLILLPDETQGQLCTPCTERVKLRHQESKHLPRGTGRNRGMKINPQDLCPNQCPTEPSFQWPACPSSLTELSRKDLRGGQKGSLVSYCLFIVHTYFVLAVNLHPFLEDSIRAVLFLLYRWENEGPVCSGLCI